MRDLNFLMRERMRRYAASQKISSSIMEYDFFLNNNNNENTTL